MINILLAAIIVWLGADTFLVWRQSGSNIRNLTEKQSAPSVNTHKTNRENKELTYFYKVINKNIFKTSLATEKPKEEDIKPSKEVEITKLELKLKGTVLGENNRSYAVIEDLRNRTQDLYYLDDLIQGARIVEILPDRVVLNVEGRKEILPLSMESEGIYRRSTISRRPKPRRSPVKRYNYPRRVRPRKEKQE